MSNRELDDYPRDLIHNIETYGFQVTSVFDPKGKAPNFAYSIGIQKTTGQPEMIVFGMRPRIAHYLISTYFEQVKAGQHFAPNRQQSGFSKKFPIFIQPVSRRKCNQYMAGADGFYGPLGYQAVQLIYPDKHGRWPWSTNAEPNFRSSQTLLGPVPLGKKRTPTRRELPLNRSRLQFLKQGQS
jgi:hypothetical protein